jgi:hypothetical protein
MVVAGNGLAETHPHHRETSKVLRRRCGPPTYATPHETWISNTPRNMDQQATT